MPSSLSTLRALCAAIALLFVFAQPAAAQLSFKPTAEAVQEDKLLKALKEGDKITGRIIDPGHDGLQPDPAGGPRLARFPAQQAADHRRRRHPRNAGAAGDLPDGARPDSRRSRLLRHQDPALCELRALHPLADGELLHRAGAVGPQHQLRPGPDPAAVRRRGIRDHVGLRQDRARLPGVSVHARPRRSCS